MKNESQHIYGLKCIQVALPKKQEALLFDKIGIISFESSINDIERKKDRADLEWLIDQEFLFDAPISPKLLFLTNNPILHSCLEASYICIFIKLALQRYPLDPAKSIPDLLMIAKHYGVEDLVNEIDFTNFVQHLKTAEENEIEKTADTFVNINFDILTRAMSYFFREYLNLNCVPCLDIASRYKPRWIPVWKDQTIAQLFLYHFPVPADSVPWKDIIEFKNTSETKTKFNQLRRWMKKVANDQLKPNEISEEIEYLINDHTQYMKIQKMKYSTASLEFILTTLAGIAEDIVKLRLESAINRFYLVRKRKIALMESEIIAPGREIAYLVHAMEKFRD